MRSLYSSKMSGISMGVCTGLHVGHHCDIQGTHKYDFIQGEDHLSIFGSLCGVSMFMAAVLGFQSCINRKYTLKILFYFYYCVTIIRHFYFKTYIKPSSAVRLYIFVLLEL